MPVVGYVKHGGASHYRSAISLVFRIIFTIARYNNEIRTVVFIKVKNAVTDWRLA